MRRFMLALVATVVGLVLLLSFKTNSSRAGAHRPIALAGTTPGAPDSPAASNPASAAASVLASSPAAVSSPASAPSSAAAPQPTAPQPTAPQATQATPTPSTKPSPTHSATPKATTAAVTKTATGSTIDVSEGFRTFGQVQVRVTMKNGRIVDDSAIRYPQNDGQSYEISAYAIPQLEQEALQAQSANIDVVSGATYTSYAYAQSLQAALDKLK